MSKVNVLPIVKEHLETLQDNRTKRTSLGDYLLFFCLPAASAVPLIWVNYGLSDGIRSVLVVAIAVSVFNVMLLPNVMLLAYDVGAANTRRQGFLREVYTNLAFAVLVGIVTLVLVVITAFVPQNVVATALSGAVYYLSGVFLLTVLMVLKRIHAIFSG